MPLQNSPVTHVIQDITKHFLVKQIVQCVDQELISTFLDKPVACLVKLVGINQNPGKKNVRNVKLDNTNLKLDN